MSSNYFMKDEMQGMQDAFVKVNHVYCIFVEKDLNQFTSFSGSKEEENFLSELLTKEVQAKLIGLFTNVKGEDVVGLSTDCPYFLLRGVGVRDERDNLLGAWLVAGIDESQITEDIFIPKCVQRTNATSFDETVALLEVLSNRYFNNKNQLVVLEADKESLVQEESRMEYLLRKNEVLTDILKRMESEEVFSRVVEQILSEAAEYLMISNAHLLKIDIDGETVDLVCEYSDKREHSLVDKLLHTKKAEFPFMTERPYTISADTMITEPFQAYFDKFKICAGTFLPVGINGRTAMYLCFVVMEPSRKWTTEDVTFMNDIKRVVQTILSKRVTNNSLASSYSTLESILENTGCGVSVVDMVNRTVLYTNETYKQMQLSAKEQQEFEQYLLLPESQIEEVMEYHATECDRWYEISYSSMNWVDNRQVRLMTVYDITKIKQYQEKMEYQATVDYLTGLYNRVRLEDDLPKEIYASTRAGEKAAMLLIDMDDFGNINDGLGHQMGDMLLKKVATSLRSIPGIEDCCYRIDGDEFIVLLPHERFNQLDRVISNIQKIATHTWDLENSQYYCTMSIGVVSIPEDGMVTDVLFQRAYIALHTAKKQGKNRVEFYDSDQMNSAVERLDLEKRLRSAVEQGCKEFEVYYQPLIDISNNSQTCCGAEALVRWNSPEVGMMMPAQFIALAEYLGLINEIGRHVLVQACKRCKYWNDFGHPEYKINVNLSVVQLMQNDIVDTVKDALEATGLNPHNLTLEVTEGLAINDLKRTQEILGEIREMGVRVALDDFGTGYSSLNHIRSMPIDVIKIDRCFVEDIGEDVFSDAFVKSVTQLAEALHMNICVEGVEDERQKNVLGEMNIDMIQGFLFDKPLAAEDFEKKYLQ